MAFIPAENVVRVFMAMTINGVGNRGHVLHFEKSGAAPVLADLTDLAEAIFGWQDDQYKGVLTDNVIFTGLNLRDLSSEFSWFLNYSTGYPLTGSTTGDSAPGQVSLVIKFGTGLIGAGNRGRVFTPPPLETSISGNAIDTGLANSVRTAWEELPSALSVAPAWQHVVTSFVEDNSPRAFGVSHPVTTYSVGSYGVRTRRSRLGI